jgi:hypothetical protein
MIARRVIHRFKRCVVKSSLDISSSPAVLYGTKSTMQSANPLLMELLTEITIVVLRLVDILENGCQEGVLQPLDQCW